MSRRFWILIAIVVICAGPSAWWLTHRASTEYLTVPASQGDIVSTIVATGSVNPVVTVQVGSYVSGVIKSLYCDYNTQVKAGQLCAKIDPKPFQVAVDQARGNLLSAQAQLDKDQASLSYAHINYARDQKLVHRGIVSKDTLDSDKSTFEQAKAQIQLDKATIIQKKAALEAAEVNLAYTNIVSPVDGTVVSRNIDVGQTVAASFQTPTLFLIAQDLTKMQVDTNVSESDIGSVKVGESAFFTVEAYPNKRFYGKVTQVREAPITVQNVVTYDAVISVSNPERLLLPGMTANARIITAERQGVLRVPTQALRFSPTGISETSMGHNPSSRQTSHPHLWVLRDHQPVKIPVKTGLSDGTHIEIMSNNLKPGDAVIVGERSSQSGQGSQSRSRTPFGL